MATAKKKSIWSQMYRVLRSAKKPSNEELWLVIKVTFVAILFLGFIGFGIRTLFTVVLELGQ